MEAGAGGFEPPETGFLQGDFMAFLPKAGTLSVLGDAPLDV